MQILDVKSLVFVGLMMQGFGTLFLTVQLWGAAWGLEHVLGLAERTGRWQHMVRDGLWLHIVGTLINIMAFYNWLQS